MEHIPYFEGNIRSLKSCNVPAFMESDSSYYVHKTASGPDSKPDQSNPQRHSLYFIIPIILSSFRFSHQTLPTRTNNLWTS